MQCNWPTSDKGKCYYESSLFSMQCYFHDKVRRGLIDGYYGNSSSGGTDTQLWVAVR